MQQRAREAAAAVVSQQAWPFNMPFAAGKDSCSAEPAGGRLTCQVKEEQQQAWSFNVSLETCFIPQLTPLDSLQQQHLLPYSSHKLYFCYASHCAEKQIMSRPIN